MFLEHDMTRDKDDLKARVDLRDIVAEAWGPGRRSGKSVMYRARWRDGDRHPSFAVYADGFKDFGGSGDSGDVYTWLEREYQMTFAEAVDWVRNRVYGSGPTPLRPARRRAATASNEPPPAAWQRAAREALRECQAYLWSDAADARRVREYLSVERGLTEETMRVFGLGYNPGWKKTKFRYWSATLGRQRRARLVPGIVIPWYRGEILVALRVRCRVGRLAAWLAVPADTVRGESLDKYRSYYGSKLAGTLFNGDSITPERTLVLVEGEFDAMLAQQAVGSLAAVVTLGSATNRLTRRLREQLVHHPQIYSVLDQDNAGQNATERLQRVLGERHQPLSLPIGKDITEYVVEYGGDLARWLRESTGPALHAASDMFQGG